MMIQDYFTAINLLLKIRCLGVDQVADFDWWSKGETSTGIIADKIFHNLVCVLQKLKLDNSSPRKRGKVKMNYWCSNLGRMLTDPDQRELDPEVRSLA